MATARIDVDLSEFDEDDIVDEAIEIARADSTFRAQIQRELFAGNSGGLHTKILSVRDQQYKELFDKLKDRYSFFELQEFLDKP